MTREEIEEFIEKAAEKAAVSASALTGQKVATQVSQGLEKTFEEVLHGSPISPYAEEVLGKVPACWDFRGIRSWVLTRAWQIMEKERLKTLPVGRAWRDARIACWTVEGEKEAKAKEMCRFPHMDQIPACKVILEKEVVKV